MAFPQGLAHFPGLQTIKGASFTFSHGVTPSRAIITTVPHTKFLATIGTFTLTFGNTKIQFPDCFLDEASLEISRNGQIWTLRLLDRRWKWSNEGGGGHVSGAYNVRKADGGIKDGTEQTPQELAKLLLNAMGETKYSVSDLPNKPRPEVHWDYSNPSRELARLCEDLGCRVVLGLDNRVRLRKVGKGKTLPAGGAIIAGNFGIDTHVVPDSLIVVGAPVRFQSYLYLEAVGEETDGSIKPINELSYKPTNGWEAYDPPLWEISKTYQRDGGTYWAYDLAAKSVFRWYRVVAQVDGKKLAPPGWHIEPNNIDELLPLADQLVDTEWFFDDKEKKAIKRRKPFQVDGTYFNYDDIGLFGSHGREMIEDFTVDRERGIIKFRTYIYGQGAVTSNKRNPRGFIAEGGDDTIVPELWLLCSYYLDDAVTGEKVRYERTRKTGQKNGTGARIVRRPEIEHTFKGKYQIVEADAGMSINSKGHETNKKDADEEADGHLDAIEKQFQSEPSTTVDYAGFLAIEPDGAIQQLSWRCGNGQPATTRASRNEEHNKHGLSYKSKRKTEEQERIEAQAEELRKVGARAVGFVKDLIGRFTGT